MVKKCKGRTFSCLYNPLFVSAVSVCVLLFFGIVRSSEKNNFISLFDPSEITRLEGFLSSNPVKTKVFDSYKADFAVEKCFLRDGSYSLCRGKVLLYIPKEDVEKFYPGKLYTSAGKSSEDVLFENGARMTVSAKKTDFYGGKESFLVLDARCLGWKGNSFFRAFYRFRGLCRLQFKRLMYSWGSAGGFLLALFSGSREYSEDDVSLAFKNTGLSHILALSGMHISLFGGIAYFIGKKTSSKNIADLIRLVANLFFVWFAGISPSLFRAFLSCLIIYISSLIRINSPSPISVLSLCFLLHVMIFPSHVNEISFILSYSAITGIILTSFTFTKIIHPLIPYKLRKSLASSFAAQLFTFPASIKFFGKVMPIGIIATVVVSPFVSAFIYAGAIGIVICLIFPILSQPIHGIIQGLYQIIKFLVFIF